MLDYPRKKVGYFILHRWRISFLEKNSVFLSDFFSSRSSRTPCFNLPIAHGQRPEKMFYVPVNGTESAATVLVVKIRTVPIAKCTYAVIKAFISLSYAPSTNVTNSDNLTNVANIYERTRSPTSTTSPTTP